jgi:hypothetical protein
MPPIPGADGFMQRHRGWDLERSRWQGYNRKSGDEGGSNTGNSNGVEHSKAGLQKKLTREKRTGKHDERLDRCDQTIERE